MAESLFVHEVELKRRGVLRGHVTKRMGANARPLTSLKVLMDMSPQFVVPRP